MKSTVARRASWKKYREAHKELVKERQKKWREANPDYVYHTFTEKTCSECGDKFNQRDDHKAVTTKCSTCNKPPVAYREANKSWVGGKTNHDGYVLIGQQHGHPKAKGKGKYIAEHRLVMEKHLGRTLGSKEVIHHINENRSDNRLENLQVMSIGEHLTHRGQTLKGAK